MTTYDETKALAICQRLEDEPALGLRQILRDAGVPKSTFHDWRGKHEALEKAYQAAKQSGYDNLAQECLAIADDGTNDYTVDKDGNEVLDREHIQRSKVRIETRMKLLAKWFPEKYGERVAVDHGVQSNLADRLKEARERLNGR